MISKDHDDDECDGANENGDWVGDAVDNKQKKNNNTTRNKQNNDPPRNNDGVKRNEKIHQWLVNQNVRKKVMRDVRPTLMKGRDNSSTKGIELETKFAGDVKKRSLRRSGIKEDSGM